MEPGFKLKHLNLSSGSRAHAFNNNTILPFIFRDPVTNKEIVPRLIQKLIVPKSVAISLFVVTCS